MSFEKINGVYKYKEIDPEYDHEEYYQEVSSSNLRRSRNAHLLLGCLLGVGLTLGTQYLLLWVTGVL